MNTQSLGFEHYFELDDESCRQRINAAKKALGEKLVILGHHYQREEVYCHADITGDSLGLAQAAAKTQAKYIVFCGVHFMAEVSSMLTRPDQTTILPDMAAGCSMADMANLPAVERCWQELATVFDPDTTVTPITYINSAANLKAFCGRHGGIVCTSPNAKQILEWGFAQREKLLFFPDQHLGRNTAYKMGIPLEQMVVWDYTKPMGGLTPEAIKNAKVILWKGHCSVHAKFKPEDIDNYLKLHPEAKILAHPEACFEVCQRADYVGSTAYIIKTVKESAPGTHWLVATELNLVNRLHERYKQEEKIVKFMAPTISMCSTMFRIDQQHLTWVLENLVAGNIVNQVTVTANVQQYACLAINKMLELSR